MELLRVRAVSFEKKNSNRPLYLQVRDHLAQQIARGTFKPGALLPNELEFAERLGVSLGTLRRGLETLEKERLITRRQGSGTYVRDHAVGGQPPLDNIRTKTGERIPFRVELLGVEEARAGPDEIERLAVGHSETVIRCRQVRYFEGPFMFEEIVLAKQRFTALCGEQLSSPYHLPALAQKHGVLLGTAWESVEITAATAQVGLLLGLKPGASLLKLDRIHYSLGRVPLEWRSGYCALTSVKYISKVGADGP